LKNNFLKRATALLVWLAIANPVSMFAQTKFGLRAGLNATTVSFDNLENRTERIGFHVGGFVEIPLIINFLAIQPELSYSTKGTAFKPLNERQTLNLEYVDFLLPVAFQFGDFDLQVGPFASYLVSKPDYTVYNNSTIVVDAFEKADFGLSAGMTYTFAHVLIGARYNQGLADISNDDLRPFLGSGKTAVAQLSLGVKF
jgi:Outer membrane protein beta-barrel domain